MNDRRERETVTVRIYRERWKELKKMTLEKQLDGDSEFCIADAIEEVIRGRKERASPNPDCKNLDEFTEKDPT